MVGGKGADGQPQSRARNVPPSKVGKSCDGLSFRVVQHEELLRGVAASVKEDRLLSSGVLSI